MGENLDLDDLKRQLRDQYNRRNHGLTIELANKILEQEPDYYDALEYRLVATYGLKQDAPEAEKEQLSPRYKELALAMIKYMEEKGDFTRDSRKQYTYVVARNNLGWEEVLHGKTEEEWETGLKHVEVGLKYDQPSFALDTKIRLLLKLERNSEAYEIALSMLRKNEKERDVQDIKSNAEFIEWVKKKHPTDVLIVDKHEGMNLRDKAFLQELESLLKKTLKEIEPDKTGRQGFRTVNDRITSLFLRDSYNLESIPESIGNLDHLKELEITYNGNLRTLPENLGNLKNLEALTIKNCYLLNNLPESLGNLENLRWFTIDYLRSVETLPNTIGNLKNLETLYINQIGSNSLPESMERLKKLSTLKIKNCSFESLPEGICELSSLTNLEIKHCNSLRTLPKNIAKLKSLEILILENLSGIDSLPESFGELEKLSKLEMTKLNELPVLPESIGELHSLGFLTINRCRGLKDLPESIGNLPNLREFRLIECNGISTIPNNFSKLQKLETIEINSLSDDFKGFSDNFGNLKSLNKVSISSCNGIESLPDTIDSLHYLKDLEISSCRKLKNLPRSIGGITSLVKLSLYECDNIELLPVELTDLASLEEIRLDNCQKLCKLPDSFTKLQNLRRIYINKCPSLQLIPDEFVNLKSIEEIIILRSGLKAPPDKLNSFKNLKKLELSGNIYSPDKDEKMELIKKRWKKYENPWRRFILWGWDEKNNPSYIILYGKHDFMGLEININDKEIEDFAQLKVQSLPEGKRLDIKPGVYNVLQDDVKYSCYAVFHGKKGHLPSFQAIKVIQKSHYDYKTRSYSYDDPEMYFKKDISYHWGWKTDKKKMYKEFNNLKESKKIVLPYFALLSYKQLVNKIHEQKFQIKGFRIASSLNEILQLPKDKAEYIEIIVKTINHQNIYIRKKYLFELLSKGPSKDILASIIKVGSSELISGIFLELAKLQNPILLNEAQNIIDGSIEWTDESFARGVKRCATIYVNSLDSEKVKQRSNWILKNLPNADLHLKKLRGEEIPPEKRLTGATYRKYAQQGYLNDNYKYYDYNSRDYIYETNRYDIGAYSNGMILNIIEFKNTIQEAEIYQLSNIIGKIAYYIDAPRIVYYLKGSKKTKALRYFQSYLRRIISSIADKDELKFMEIMKDFLTSFKPEDSVSKYANDFSSNTLLRFFMYHDFSEIGPDRKTTTWEERAEYYSVPKMMRLTGRREFKKEIWDRHLDVVLEIVLNAQIDSIKKACYYILKETSNLQEFVDKMSFKQIIQLALASYEPLAGMFLKILNEKMEKIETFDPELMLALIGSSDDQMQHHAMDFFNRTNGSFAPETVADFIFLDNLDRWFELFQQNLTALKGDNFAQFLESIINKIPEFIDKEISISQETKDLLSNSTQEMEYLSPSVKKELITVIIEVISKQRSIPDWTMNLLEECIFSIPYEDLDLALKGIDIDSFKGAFTQKRIIFAILKAIKNNQLPSNPDIIDLLDIGTAKIINTFLTMVSRNKEELSNRFSTLLVMFESEVISLNLHAADVFNELPREKQKRLHSMVIDSPVHRAYEFGLKKLESVYGDLIPDDMIIQMLEHGSSEVKAYVSRKINNIIENLGNGDKNLFMYYLHTLLLLPNKHAKSKNKIYNVLPKFALKYQDKIKEIERMLLDIGGSNVIADSERALVALAKIKKEVQINAS
ncbi:MAG: hypothetical protein JW891_11890 [Candidatus Lokiarchaeota archaeon]|nr:hypothetical protein [Candidatus Lokiarchaeota archaeon]